MPYIQMVNSGIKETEFPQVHKQTENYQILSQKCWHVFFFFSLSLCIFVSDNMSMNVTISHVFVLF